MKLVNTHDEALICRELEERHIGAISLERMRILRILSRKAMYAAQLSRELGMDEQALHYHLKLLQESGLIAISDYEERRGGIAKRFTATAESIGIIIKENGWKHLPRMAARPPRLFAPFIEHAAFSGIFVLGSPDPHGKYRARSSEFSVLELAMLMGNYATFSFPLYALDTQLKEEGRKQNLIIAGGPKVNMLAAEINAILPIRFDAATFEVVSTLTRKRYGGNIGVIELVGNPFAPKKKVLLVGGLNHHGTRAAVLAMIKKMKAVEEGNPNGKKAFARVVEGFDDDADGIVDSVDIIE